MLKILSKLSTLVFLVLHFDGCRKDVIEKEENFFNNGCEINSFQLIPGLVYNLDYKTPNTLRGYNNTQVAQELAFEAQIEGIKLLKLDVGNLPNLKMGSSRFEYSDDGLIKITFLTNSFYNINNNIDSLDEMSKVE
jgi:hypothetical protein